MLHLTLVAVMTTLMPEYGQNQAQYSLLTDHVRTALAAYAKMFSEMSDARTLLWALYAGYVTVLKETDEGWIVPLVREMCERLGMSEWDDVRNVLYEFGWIGVFYNERGQRLCERSKRGRNPEA